jgi:hypothetical protein
VIGLALVAAVSVAMPAVGASPSSIARKALRTAKKADKRSKQALSRSNKALKGTTGDKGDPGANGTNGTNGTNGLGAIMGFATVNNTPRFTPLNGGSPSGTDNRRILSPNRAITLSELAVVVSPAPDGGNSITFTVNSNGAATPLTCTIPDGSTSCSSAASVAIPARSLLSLASTQSGTVDTLDTSWSLSAG